VAEVTRQEAIRATAPLDDPVLGGEPLVVDPTDTARLIHGAYGRARLEHGEATTHLVLLDATAPSPGLLRREVLVDGWSILVDVEPASRAALRERARRAAAAGTRGGSLEVRAIIPGRVLSVAVVAGEDVQAGQPLVVVEAMKMQNELRAPRDGTVERVAASAGATVELGDVLVVLS
jgi:glutaconyl-CoA decarboxylase